MKNKEKNPCCDQPLYKTHRVVNTAICMLIEESLACRSHENNNSSHLSSGSVSTNEPCLSQGLQMSQMIYNSDKDLRSAISENDKGRNFKQFEAKSSTDTPSGMETLSIPNSSISLTAGVECNDCPGNISEQYNRPHSKAISDKIMNVVGDSQVENIVNGIFSHCLDERNSKEVVNNSGSHACVRNDNEGIDDQINDKVKSFEDGKCHNVKMTIDENELSKTAGHDIKSQKQKWKDKNSSRGKIVADKVFEGCTRNSVAYQDIEGKVSDVGDREEIEQEEQDNEGADMALKRFACPRCDYRGKYMSHLKKHMFKHERKLNCQICGVFCRSHSELTAHMITHTHDRPFECLVCGCAFKQVVTLRQHMLAHTNVKPIVCDLCDFVCKTQKQLDAHKAGHAADELFTCSQCDFKCKTEVKLEQHKRIHFGKQSFHCHECSVSCWSQAELRKHLLIHTNVKAFSCDHCDFKCCKKPELNRHLLNHTEVNPFSCSLCEFTCRSKSLLINHTITHMNDEEDPYDAVEQNEIHKTFAAKKAAKVRPRQSKMPALSLEKPVVKPKIIQKPSTKISNYRLAKKTTKRLEVKTETNSKPIIQEEANVKDGLINCLSESITEERKTQIPAESEDDGLRRSSRTRRKVSKPNYCEIETVHFLEEEITDSLQEEYFASDKEDKCQDDEVRIDNSFVKKEMGESATPNFDPIEKALFEGRMPASGVKRESTPENDWVLQGIDSGTDNYFYQPDNNLFYCKHCQYSSETIAYLKRHMKTHTDLEFESCPHCEYFCRTASQLKEHMVKHSKEGADERPFPCDKCDFRSKTQGDLKRHILTHLKVKPFACTMCSYTCARKTRLEEHWRIHTNAKPFACHICKYKCRSRQNLNSHMKRHTNRRHHCCPHCDFKSLTRPLLKRHLQQEHADKRPFACEHCSFTSWLSTDLKKHEWIHAGLKPFECEECQYKCRRINRLKEHKMIHKNAKPHNCKICNHACRTKHHLKKHMEVHQGEEGMLGTIKKSKTSKTAGRKSKSKQVDVPSDSAEKLDDSPLQESETSNQNSPLLVQVKVEESIDNPPVHFEKEVVKEATPGRRADNPPDGEIPATLFKRRKYVRGPKRFTCKVCTYVCKKLSHLKRHMYCHTTERPYKCSQCDYTSKTEDNLRRHIKRHSGVKPYSCKLCYYRCYELGDLNQHLLTHTDFKAYKCPFCDYAARKKYHLNEHIMTHSDVKPFLCSECGDSFRTNSKLREHTFKHTTEKNIQCPQCKFKCRRQSELNKHMRRHTEPRLEKEPKAQKVREPKPFLCPECGLSFRYNSALKQHMVTHTDEKPWPCPHCPFHCRTKGQLKSHVTKHMETKPLSCEYCPFSCKHESSLRRHRLIHTCTEPLCCPLCGFTCVRNYDIKRHMQNKHKTESPKMPSTSEYPSQAMDQSSRSMDSMGSKSADDSSRPMGCNEKQMDYKSGKLTEYAHRLEEELTSDKAMDCIAGKAMDYATSKAVDCEPGKSMDYGASKSMNYASVKSTDYTETKLMDYHVGKSFDFSTDKMVDYTLKQIDYMTRHLDYAGRLIDYTSRPIEFVDKPMDFTDKPMDYTGRQMDYTIKHL